MASLNGLSRFAPPGPGFRKRQERVLRLAGDHVVEREELLAQVEEHRRDVGRGPGEDAVADPVEHLRRDRFPLHEELRHQRVPRLAVALELHDGQAGLGHPARHRHDPALHPVGQVRLAHGGAEEQLAGLHVVDHVHHLEHHAGDAPVAGGVGDAAREQEEGSQVRGLRHRRRHPVSVGRSSGSRRPGPGRPAAAPRRGGPPGRTGGGGGSDRPRRHRGSAGVASR